MYRRDDSGVSQEERNGTVENQGGLYQIVSSGEPGTKSVTGKTNDYEYVVVNKV